MDSSGAPIRLKTSCPTSFDVQKNINNLIDFYKIYSYVEIQFVKRVVNHEIILKFATKRVFNHDSILSNMSTLFLVGSSHNLL